MMYSLYWNKSCPLCSRTNKYGIIIFPKIFQLLYCLTGMDLNPQHPYLFNLLFKQFRGKPVSRDSIAQHTTGFFLRLKNPDIMAHSSQIIGCRETRRT